MDLLRLDMKSLTEAEGFLFDEQEIYHFFCFVLMNIYYILLNIRVKKN